MLITDPDRMVRQALAYARRGWLVFPCRPGGKQPATRRGFRDASGDRAQIKSWWEERPAANLGVVTGAPGPDVLDVDQQRSFPEPAASRWETSSPGVAGRLRSRPIRLRAFRHQDTPRDSRPPGSAAQEGTSMLDIATTPPIVNDDPPERCEFDCMYIDGACRCRHGEVVSREFDIPGLNDIILPF